MQFITRNTVVYIYYNNEEYLEKYLKIIIEILKKIFFYIEKCTV